MQNSSSVYRRDFSAIATPDNDCTGTIYGNIYEVWGTLESQVSTIE